MADNAGISTSIRSVLPVHVGIIMDGNGRWAERRKLNRSQGHKEGLNAAKTVVKAAAEMGIRFLTLYTFSTENWKRAEDEVSFLMSLICRNLKREYDFYRKYKIKVIHSGELGRLPTAVRSAIGEVSRDTGVHDGLIVNLAINYGGRNEIVRSVNRWLGSHKESPHLTEEALQEHLDHPEIPAPDLIIRTGGEKRISNFLLWQCAYSELFFSEKLWPDFGAEDFKEAVHEYGRRQRKFGGVH